MEDVPQDEDDEEESNKIYLIIEVAQYKEVMFWNMNTYKFEPNPFLLKDKCEYISQKHILKIISNLVSALDYLHTKVGIVHRDIKPQNILLCADTNTESKESNYSVKLCDFGVSEKLQEPFEENDAMAKSAGTYHFFPPEMCDPNSEATSGRSQDIWALGATLFCLIFNELPFWDHENCENEFAIIDYIFKNDVKLPDNHSRKIVSDEEFK